MEYQAYSSYQPTNIAWVQELPSHWNSMKISHLARLASGENITSQRINPIDDYPVYGGNGLRGYVGQYTHDGHHVLIGRQGALCGNINHAYGKFWASEHAVVVTPDREFSPNWLGFTLEVMNLGQYSVSAAQPGLSVEMITKLQMPFPSIEEQQKIAVFLDHKTQQIDQLIEKKKALIEKLEEKRIAVITQAVTKGLDKDVKLVPSGVDWLGDVPEGWICCPFKFFSDTLDCKHLTADFVSEGYPLASIGEVKGWYVDLSTAKQTTEKYYIELIGGNRKPMVGDIIYSRNATVGEAALVKKNLPKFAMGQDVCLIRCREFLLPEFVMFLLNSKVITQQLELLMVGSTFKRINVDNIRNFIIIAPPLKEQKVIVFYLEKKMGLLDKMLDANRAAIEKLQEYRSALITAAVTGKIDVRNWQPPEARQAA